MGFDLWFIGGIVEGNDATEEDTQEWRGRPVPSRLDHIINMRHELVRLADELDWDWID